MAHPKYIESIQEIDLNRKRKKIKKILKASKMKTIRGCVQ